MARKKKNDREKCAIGRGTRVMARKKENEREKCAIGRGTRVMARKKENERKKVCHRKRYARNGTKKGE